MAEWIVGVVVAFVLGAALGWLLRPQPKPGPPTPTPHRPTDWAVGPTRSGRAVATISCPKCDSRLAPTITLDLPLNHAVCFVCLAALELRRDLKVQLSGMYHERRAFVVGRRGNRPQVACPTCQQTLTALAKRHGTYYAWCVDDRVIVPIGEKSFAEWRASMDADDS